MIMDKEEFCRELEELMPYLQKRQAPLSATAPRLLVSSDMLDNPAYIELVEQAGCVVAMDDLDTGSRYFGIAVDTNMNPLHAVAKRYLQLTLPRMMQWDSQFSEITEWLKDYAIDGVVELPQTYDYPRLYRSPLLARHCKTLGVPSIALKREYHLANVEQLRTRVGAFIEMIERRGKS